MAVFLIWSEKGKTSARCGGSTLLLVAGAHELKLPGSEVSFFEMLCFETVALHESFVPGTVVVSPVLSMAVLLGKNSSSDHRCDERSVRGVLRLEEDMVTDLWCDGLLGVRQVVEREGADCGAVRVILVESSPGECSAEFRAVDICDGVEDDSIFRYKAKENDISRCHRWFQSVVGATEVNTWAI